MKYSKQYHERLVELWQWRKSFRGPGVRNTRQGVTIAPPPSRRAAQVDPGGVMNPVLLPIAVDGYDLFDNDDYLFDSATVTYSIYASLANRLLIPIATQCPLMTPRPLGSQPISGFANWGWVRTFSPSEIGVSGISDLSLFGFAFEIGSGIGSGDSGTGVKTNLGLIQVIGETYATQDYCAGTGSGSGGS